ncbi:MAG: toxin-antitoxin system YwqK family antitoxin [Bacteroidia bacterium]
MKELKIIFILFIVLVIGCNHSGKNIYKYYPNGNVHAMYVSQNDNFNDTIVYIYYENGKLENRYMTKNGLINDTTYYYYESGKLGEVAVFDSGKYNGIAHIYYEDGTLSAMGHFRNNLKTGEWISFDSLKPGKVVNIDEYVIINNKSILNKYLRFEDSTGNPHISGRYYSVVPKITAIDNNDTIYSFIVYPICSYSWMGIPRVIFGESGAKFSDFSKADTIYPDPQTGMFLIPNVNVKKTPNMKGILQYYKKAYSPKRKDSVIRAVNSYFYLAKDVSPSR